MYTPRARIFVALPFFPPLLFALIIYNVKYELSLLYQKIEAINLM